MQLCKFYINLVAWNSESVWKPTLNKGLSPSMFLLFDFPAIKTGDLLRMSVSLLFSFSIFPFVAYLTGQVCEPLSPAPEYVSTASLGSTRPSWNHLPVPNVKLSDISSLLSTICLLFWVFSFYNPSPSCLPTVREPLAPTHRSERCQTSGRWWKCKHPWILRPGCDYSACLNWILLNAVVNEAFPESCKHLRKIGSLRTKRKQSWNE